MRKHLAIFEIALIFASTAALADADWRALTLKLNAESNSRRAHALKGLRQIPNLDEQLRAGLAGPQRSLALHAIRALHRSELVGDLLKLLQDDPEGTVHGTVSVLIDERNASSIVEAFRGSLKSLPPDQGAAAKVHILGLFARRAVPIEDAELLRLIGDESYEVRQSVLDYVSVKEDLDRYLPVLDRALSLSPYTLRISALELLPKLKNKSAAVERAKACAQDRDENVREACTVVAAGLGK